MPIFDLLFMKAKNNILRALFILLFIMAVNTIQTYVLHITREFGDINFYKISTHIFGIISCTLSLLSTVAAWKIVSKNTLRKIPKIVFAFGLSILIYAIVQSLFFTAERFFVYHLPTNFDLLLGNFVFTFVIFHLYISGLSLAYFSFQENAQHLIKLETAEKDKELLQFKMLQKNLEPHFLFNNLSVLSGLVRKNPAEVDGFIHDFSDVYRYYLKHNDQELVPVEDELLFLKKYISLMEKRFKKAYHFTLDIKSEEGFILPCSLQLAVENAIKHNRGAEDHPLMIKISRENEMMIVSNDLRPVDFTQGAQMGNLFLQKSYELHFGKKVNFNTTDTHYIVEIPLIL